MTSSIPKKSVFDLSQLRCANKGHSKQDTLTMGLILGAQKDMDLRIDEEPLTRVS